MRNSTFRKNALLLFLIGFTCHLIAQNTPNDKKNYSLLWEISGNGLTKSSYLFGTMHLRDKRVFEFSDSLLLKLESCEAFASEIRMDSAFYQSWEMRVSGDTTNRLSQKLSKTAYNRLLLALKNKGINLDSMETKNSSMVQDWLTDSEEEKQADSKDLFLDLYLTRMAYTQGKSLVGLERIDDYEDLNDSFFKQFEDSTFTQKDTSFSSIMAYFAMMQNMIEVYQSGDLDKLLEVVNSQKSFNGDQHRKEMLDNRNVRMLQKFENLMQEKSVFCAVGAAHLPDTMGLIALLRAKGYSVRKVTPQFTGLAQQYKVTKKERKWYHVKDDFNHFELDFPEQPYLVNKLNANKRRLGLQYLYYDIMTGAIHIAEADFLPDMGKKMTKEKMLENAFKSWLSSRVFDNLVKEKITIGGNAGYKFSAKIELNGSVSGQFFVANGNIYKTLVIFDKHNDANTEQVDPFFKSLKINPLPLTDWQVYEDEKGAFSLRMPVKPEYQELKSEIESEDGEPIKFFFNIFQSKDTKEGFSYLIRYSDMPHGRYVEGDSLYLSEIMSEALGRFKGMSVKLEIDSVTKHYGSYPEYNVKVNFEGVSMFIRVILRANRTYYLLAQPPLEKSKANNKIMQDWINSFRLLPFKEPQLTQKEFPEIGLSVGIPTSKVPYTKNEVFETFPSKKDVSLQITDDLSGSVFSWRRSEFSKYYSTPSIDSFWRKYTNDLMDATNDLIKIDVKDTLFKGFKAKLVNIDYTLNHNTFKSLVVEKDGYQYEFTLLMPNEITNNSYQNGVFDNINFMDNKEKKDLFSSKKQLILTDIASKVDTIAEEAKTALVSTDWTRKDVPMLTQAVLKKYADDTLEEGSMRVILINKITKLKDEKTLPLLEKLVKDTEKDSVLNQEILDCFLEIDTLNSANRYFELMSIKKPKQLKGLFYLRRFMIDSTERAKLYYDKMIDLTEKPFDDEFIVYITNSLAESDTTQLMKNIFDRYTPQYLASANALFERNKNILTAIKAPEKDSVNEDFYALIAYIELFQSLPSTPQITQFFKNILPIQRLYSFSKALFYLLKNGQTIDNTMWQKLQKDKGILISLFIDLEESKLLGKVPPQYLNQKDIAEGHILYLLEDDYGKPNEFSFVETQKYKGELIYVYKFNTKYEDEISEYIAICSQPTDKTKYQLEPNILMVSDVLTDKTPTKKVVENLLKGLKD
jgi:uncharacterized protein YbaP (TraB family)